MKGNEILRVNIIFKGMKIGAAILLLLIGFFTIQPVLKVESKSSSMKCSKMSGCCRKKMAEKNKKKACEGMSCNPFVGCPYYSLFLTSKSPIAIVLPISREKILTSNDNRTIQNSSDFWHPPNYVVI